MSDSTRSKAIEVMAEAVRLSRINDVYDADEIASDILAHLEAEGMAVVPVGALKAGVANYADIALQDAMEEVEDGGHKIHVYRDDLFLKSMEGNGFRVVPASPYGKASMQEASAEREARSEQIPPGKEESK